MCGLPVQVVCQGQHIATPAGQTVTVPPPPKNEKPGAGADLKALAEELDKTRDEVKRLREELERLKKKLEK